MAERLLVRDESLGYEEANDKTHDKIMIGLFYAAYDSEEEEEGKNGR